MFPYIITKVLVLKIKSISSRIQEEVFEDPHDKEGSNRMGIYTVRMVIH